jgi:uncharacterized protein (DUF488 family)
MHPIWTLGHSTLAPEDFIRLIQGAGIQAIADVRSIPFSGRQPHYSSPNLRHLLENAGIRHVYLGDLVGGRPRHSGLYTPTGRADFRAMAQSEWFLRGLERILAGLKKMSIGLMCGEEDPLPCHRGLLIAPELVARGLEPRHLRKGGRVETQRELEDRMLAAAGMEPSQGDLFLTGGHSGPIRVGLAREILAEKHAWRLESTQTDDSGGHLE